MEKLSNGLIPIYVNYDIDNLSTGSTNITDAVDVESKKILNNFLKKYNNKTNFFSKVFKVIFYEDVFRNLIIPSAVQIYDEYILYMTFCLGTYLYQIFVTNDMDGNLQSITITKLMITTTE